jgi:hypothetical protein
MQLILYVYCYVQNNGFIFMELHYFNWLVPIAHLAVLRTTKQKTLRATGKPPEFAWYSWRAAALEKNWEQITNFWMEHL